MNPGPLRRLVGVLGLLALAPIAVLLLNGSIGPVAAAQRAVVVLLVVVVVGRLTGSYLQSIARRFEDAMSDVTEEDAAPAVPSFGESRDRDEGAGTADAGGRG